MPIIRSRHHMPRLSLSAEGDKLKICHAEDVEAVARRCQEERKDHNKQFSKKRGFQRIARIPAIVWLENKALTNEDGSVDEKALKRFLYSPQGEMYRTVERGL